MLKLFLGTFTHTSIDKKIPSCIIFHVALAKNITQGILPNFIMKTNPFFGEYIINMYKGYFYEKFIYEEGHCRGKYDNGILELTKRIIFSYSEKNFECKVILHTMGMKKVYLSPIWVDGNDDKNKPKEYNFFDKDFSNYNDIPKKCNWHQYEEFRMEKNKPNKVKYTPFKEENKYYEKI